ncbi:uncharacterized protein CBL_04554 [Carabus blaptoides fortunei]
MRLFVLYTFFIVLSALGTAVDARPNQDGRQCFRSNEIYTECGPACPQTCDSVLLPEPVGCIALCVPGCFCKAGYVRNRWGNCIPQEKCPCKRSNEIYTCGSACQTTCDTLNQECDTNNQQCTTACFCQAGFARDKTDLCIPVQECPGYKPT